MGDEEDVRAGPLPDRLVSKKWKVRLAAYEDLQNEYDRTLDDKPFLQYGKIKLIKKK